MYKLFNLYDGQGLVYENFRNPAKTKPEYFFKNLMSGLSLKVSKKLVSGLMPVSSVKYSIWLEIICV